MSPCRGLAFRAALRREDVEEEEHEEEVAFAAAAWACKGEGELRECVVIKLELASKRAKFATIFASAILRALFLPRAPFRSNSIHTETSLRTAASASSNSLLPPSPPRIGRHVHSSHVSHLLICDFVVWRKPLTSTSTSRASSASATAVISHTTNRNWMPLGQSSEIPALSRKASLALSRKSLQSDGFFGCTVSDPSKAHQRPWVSKKCRRP